jgi:uncharacterized protein YbaR (Trm112 family)
MEKERIREYLEVLACPSCKGDLEYKEGLEGHPEGFYCKKCGLLYPIIEDIPVMLPEEAISLKEG